MPLFVKKELTILDILFCLQFRTSRVRKARNVLF